MSTPIVPRRATPLLIALLAGLALLAGCDRPAPPAQLPAAAPDAVVIPSPPASAASQ